MKKFKLKISQTVMLEHTITVLAESEQMLDSMINIVESLPMCKREYTDEYVVQLKKQGIKVESYDEEDLDYGIVLENYCSNLAEIEEEKINYDD